MVLSKKRLHELIKNQEKAKVDFKSTINFQNPKWSQEFGKDVTAIANIHGKGYLLIGIDNKGKPLGIKRNLIKEERLQETITKHCDPPVTIHFYEIRDGGKNIGVIEIPHSNKRPHRLIDDGAFHIRQGSTTRFMTTQEIIIAGTKKIQLEKGKINDYSKLPERKRVNKIADDIRDVFPKFGFDFKFKKIRHKLEGYSSAHEKTIGIFENKKNKQRYFLDIYPDSPDKTQLNYLFEDIGMYYFYSLKNSENWLSACLILIPDNLRKSVLFNKIDPHYRGFETSQNTIVQFSPSMTYFGIGEQENPTIGEMSGWSFPTSMPKFFLSNVFSKEDIETKLVAMLDFIEENKTLFDFARKLKNFQMKSQGR